MEKNEGITNPFYEKIEDPVAMTLKYFGKEELFEIAFNKLIDHEKKKKVRTQKWNGKHIIDIFGVPSKNLNPIKRKFEESFGSK